MRTPRKDKQLFKDLNPEQLKAVVDGLGMVIEKRLMTDGLSVLDVRPVYILLERAKAELLLKGTNNADA